MFPGRTPLPSRDQATPSARWIRSAYVSCPPAPTTAGPAGIAPASEATRSGRRTVLMGANLPSSGADRLDDPPLPGSAHRPDPWDQDHEATWPAEQHGEGEHRRAEA